MLYNFQLNRKHHASARSLPRPQSPIGQVACALHLGGIRVSFSNFIGRGGCHCFDIFRDARSGARATRMWAVAGAFWGRVAEVTPSQVASLQSILDSSQPGHTIQLADGVYALPQTLVMRVPGVNSSSKSIQQTAPTPTTA